MRTGKMRMGGVVLTVAALTALAACSSSSSHAGSAGTGTGTSTGSGSKTIGLEGQFGSVPAESTAAETAGTITVASPPNSAPTWILPIVTAADNSVYSVTEFDYNMYAPLYWFVNGVAPKQLPSLSLANTPTWSNNDKTVSLTLKDFKWSDGQPVTSQDILFWWYELKAGLKESAANWAYYTPGLGIPDEVASVTAPNANTVTFNLTKSVNPQWFWENELSAIQPMPSHAWDIDAAGGSPVTDWATNPADAAKIYNYLSTASKSLSTYATNSLWQVVDGPYKLSAYDASSGGFTMVPNTTYGGPHAKVESNWQVVPFTSDDAEFNAVKAGKVDIGYTPLTDVPQVNTLASQYNEFGYSDFGFSFVAYNFPDTTGDFNKIIAQLYVRQALAHLEDEPGYVKAFFYGAGGQAFGPVPEIPQSPFTPANALTNPYPYSPSTAESLLKSHGWTIVPNGTDTCSSPGTGPTNCGAGIPAGTKLQWNVIYNTSPAIIPEQVEDWASEAKTVGITMNLSSSNFNTMIQSYNDPSSPKNIDKWAMEDFGGETNSTYPTTFGVFNCQGSGNLGGYCDPQADKDIIASISSPNPAAVTTEASYLTQQQPALFQPNNDDAFGTAAVLVWQKNVSGTPISFEGLTQANWTPQFWFLTK
jgi:peptide/nickel transport system substrate-binding protein